MAREVIRSVFVGLGLLGVILSAHGAWIPAKGWLAQRLLERAWYRAGEGEVAPLPWPWADTWPIAELRAPAQGVSLVVLEGASGPTLAFGPGRHPNGADIEGEGNIVLAAHRDTHFRFLAKVAIGDRLELEGADGIREAYRVTSARVAHESETWLLDEGDTPTLTLLTCYPFDAPLPGGPLRYAVVAERLPAVRDAAHRGSDGASKTQPKPGSRIPISPGT
jgi:sortase A